MRVIWHAYMHITKEEIIVIISHILKKKIIIIIYTIIGHKSVDVRKLQVAILARSPQEMSQTDRILPRYILSRVRVSVRPRIFVYAKKPQTTVARPAAVDHRSAADKRLNWNGHDPFSSAPRAQREDVVAECSDQGSNPIHTRDCSSIGAVYEIPQSCHTVVVHSVDCSIPGHPCVRKI